ncbi:unnamed protein product [Caretta caretta]
MDSGLSHNKQLTINSIGHNVEFRQRTTNVETHLVSGTDLMRAWPVELQASMFPGFQQGTLVRPGFGFASSSDSVSAGRELNVTMEPHLRASLSKLTSASKNNEPPQHR